MVMRRETVYKIRKKKNLNNLQLTVDLTLAWYTGIQT